MKLTVLFTFLMPKLQWERLQAVIFGLFLAICSMQSVANLPARCIATLDWTVAETLIALGESDFCAMGEIKSYQHWVAEPQLPTAIIDLGIRMQPNPEQISTLVKMYPSGSLRFINSRFYQQAEARLTPFPVQIQQVDFYAEGDSWQNIVNATQKVAEWIEKPQQAEQLLTRYWQKIAEIRPLVQPYTDRPVALVQFIDSRHLRIYGQNSLLGAVLTQLGFQNSWQGSSNYWGFSTIEVTQLAKLPPNSRFVVVKPYPNNIHLALQHNTLWQHLAMAQDPLILPAVWTFGAIPSAQRFAEIFAQQLIQGGEGW